jgi:hypothetical protein
MVRLSILHPRWVLDEFQMTAWLTFITCNADNIE